MRRDAYDVLGVERGADERQIKKRFRVLARELHPDVNPEPDAEERFKEAAECYEVLSDSERRQIYDRYGWEGLDSRGKAPHAHGFGSFSDIFDAFFGGDPFGGGRRGGGPGPVQGGDVGVEAEITLEQAARGVAVTVAFDAVETCDHCHGNRAEPGTPIGTCTRCEGSGQLRAISQTAFGQMVRSQVCDRCGGDGKVATTPCSACRGQGRRAAHRSLDVDVPAGIADGQRIRLTGSGHAGDRGGPPGDLYVLVRVAEDERFVRDGADLVSVVDVSAPDAALGVTVSVPTLDGEQEVDVEPGTQPGTVVTLRGQGMPLIGRDRRGDQRVVLNVVIPRNLDERQRELLAELARTITADNLHEPRRESIVDKVRRALG
ncbi:MAG TPA: molecular chaperone DnaJ [Thermoleophilaceae bacterium]|nr:molecular chaperone DnaJ [Thermoleophilaceae bacterium]